MAAHRYWRLYLTDHLDTLFIQELQLFNSSGVNLTGSGTASALTGTAANAFDSDLTTLWISTQLTAPDDQWLKYDFGSAVDVRTFCLIPSRGGGNVVSFKLQYSDDNSTWTDASAVFAPDWTQISGRTSLYWTSTVGPEGFSFPIATPAVGYYTNWRINVTAIQDDGVSNHCGCVELELHAVPSGTNIATGGLGFSAVGGAAIDTPAAFAFDADTATEWQSGRLDLGKKARLGYAFPKAVSVKEITWQGSSELTSNPLDFTVEGSNDGLTWDTLGSFTAVDPWASALDIHTFAIATRVSATAGTTHESGNLARYRTASTPHESGNLARINSAITLHESGQHGFSQSSNSPHESLLVKTKSRTGTQESWPHVSSVPVVSRQESLQKVFPVHPTPGESTAILHVQRTSSHEVAFIGPVGDRFTVNLSAKEFGPNPPKQYLTVSWTQGGPHAFTAASDVPWMTVTPTSGTTPQTLQVSVDQTALALGSHEGHITITGSPQSIVTVILSVGPNPYPKLKPGHRVLLKLPGRNFVDYSEFVFLPDNISGGSSSVSGGGGQSSQSVTLTKVWEINTPPKCSFFVGGDLNDLGAFVPPVTGTEVWIDSDSYPEFFTGFITNEPEVVPVGANDAIEDPTPPHAFYAYVCSCVGEEILLDMHMIGFIQPFVNMQIGDIIAVIANILVPGRFDMSALVGWGDVLPVFSVLPTEIFSVIVSRLLVNKAAKIWFKRGKAFIAHFDENNPAVESSISETELNYDPYALTIKPVSSQIINDVTGIGDIEPQVYAREYFLGDGITTNFPLKLPLFGTLGKPTVQDDFSGTSFDKNIWADFGVEVSDSSDPSGVFVFDSGRLNVIGGLGLDATKLILKQGVEVKGQLTIDAGEFQFIDPSDAIVGGLYRSETLTLENCLYGFRFTKNGDQTNIQPIVDGALVGDIMVTKANQTYSLHIMLSTAIHKTTLPPWYSLNNVYGGGTDASPVTVSFLVEENYQLAVRDANKRVLHSVTQIQVPAFLFVGEFSVNDANFVVNYFQITQPIQGALYTQLVNDQDVSQRVLGFVGQSNADATVVASTEAMVLSFFKESRPLLRERIEQRYRSAGPAIARVIDQRSIALEALRYGDNGDRQAILTGLSPLPATSVELEWALQAYLDDHVRQRFEGSLTVLRPPHPYDEEPMPGRFMNIDCPSRTPETGMFSELVKVVTTSVTAESDDGTLEQFEHQFQYGTLITRKMEKILGQFSLPDPPEVATLRQISSVSAVDTALVGTQFINDLTSVQLKKKDSANLYFDAGQELADGDQIEVRYSNASWGQIKGVNFIGRFSTRVFPIPRKKRGTVIYAKLVRPL